MQNDRFIFFSEGEWARHNCIDFFFLALHYRLPRIHRKGVPKSVKEKFLKPKYMVDKTVLAFLSLLFLVSENQKVQNLYKRHTTSHCFNDIPKYCTYDNTLERKKCLEE